MAGENPHAEQFRAVLNALYSGDFGPFNAALSEDYVCHTPGRSEVAGDWHGAEQSEVKRPRMRELSGGSFKVRRLGEICIDGDWGMVPVMVTAEAAGQKLETHAFGIWRFRGDRIVEHWEMNFDQYGFDSFIANARAALTR